MHLRDSTIYLLSRALKLVKQDYTVSMLSFKSVEPIQSRLEQLHYKLSILPMPDMHEIIRVSCVAVGHDNVSCLFTLPQINSL